MPSSMPVAENWVVLGALSGVAIGACDWFQWLQRNLVLVKFESKYFLGAACKPDVRPPRQHSSSAVLRGRVKMKLTMFQCRPVSGKRPRTNMGHLISLPGR